MRAVTANKVSYGMLYRDFYTGLRPLTRSMVKVVYESQTEYATHVFMLNPTCQEMHFALVASLASMHQDERGRAILTQLGLGKWVPTADLRLIERIVRR